MRLLYNLLRPTLIDSLIRLLERDLYNTPVKSVLSKESREDFFASIFEMPAFRQYAIERETRFIHHLANQFTDEVKGQRMENMILFHKAHAAHERREKRLSSLRRAERASAVPSDELVKN